jgi:cytochrome c-type biogenesis protein CcmH
MAVFWILATLMTIVALAFVLVPLLRAPAGAAPSRVAANLEVLRSQRREIEADIANGTLPADARDEVLTELVGRAETDLDAPKPAPAAAHGRKPWTVAAIAAVAVPLIAFGTYLAVGNPGASDAVAVAAAPRSADGATTDAQIVEMVESLAKKVRERPADAQGWALLARSMAALGRFGESAEAYEQLAKLVPGDAQILADYADSLGMAQGRSLRGRPYELARQALRIDPKNRKALALAGTAAADAGDFAAAIGHWQRLAAELPADSADHAQVQAILAEMRGRASATGKALPAAPVKPAAPPAAVVQAPAAAPTSTVTGSVTVAPAMAGNVSGSETLFIFARAENGPRVPLAVLRKTARELPLQFALDDSQAMSPGMNLSSAASVRIEARISRTGNAVPQPGDLVGTSGVVKPGARDVRIVVDKVVP